MIEIPHRLFGSDHGKLLCQHREAIFCPLVLASIPPLYTPTDISDMSVKASGSVNGDDGRRMLLPSSHLGNINVAGTSESADKNADRRRYLMTLADKLTHQSRSFPSDGAVGSLSVFQPTSSRVDV